MVSLDIWLIYFFITAMAGAIFYYVEYKVASDNVIFSILKGISALTFCCTGIAFLIIKLIYDNLILRQVLRQTATHISCDTWGNQEQVSKTLVFETGYIS